MNTQFHRVILLSLASLLGFPISAYSAAADVVEGPTIELPKFIIQDTRELPPAEAWRHTEISGFEILSNASEAATRKLLRDFELFRFALNAAWPIEAKTEIPARLIVCGSGNSFDSFKSSSEAGPEKGTVSIALRDQDQAVIILDLQSSTLNLAIANNTGTNTTREVEVDHYKQFYRAYIQYVFGRTKPQPPAWLIEGVAQIVMRMDFTRKYIIFGKLDSPVAKKTTTPSGDPDAVVEDPSTPVPDQDFNLALQKQPLLPLDKFFSISQDSPEALNPLGDNVWAKQSYAFVHLCLYGRGKRYQKSFIQFVRRCGEAPVTEVMFKECFGLSYKKMAAELRGYIDFTDYDYQKLTARAGTEFSEPAEITIRDATDAEVGRIKGEALQLAGHSDAARIAFLAPYVRGARDPDLLASFGLLEHAGQRDDKARKLLEAAAIGKTTRARAYSTLASMRLADAINTPDRADGKLSSQQTIGVLEAAFEARGHPPAIAGTYEIIADAWLHSSVKPKREHLAVLNEGILKFPTNGQLLYKTAVLKLQSGFVEDAAPLIEMGSEMTFDPALKESFAKLQAALAELKNAKPAP